jgi:hypothetical protein
MDVAIPKAGNRCAAIFWQALPLMALTLLAIELAIAFPPSPDVVPGRGRDYVLQFQSQQLFHCAPEQLSQHDLEDLKRWCDCVELTTRYGVVGLQSLTDEDCQFVVEVLDDLCPDTEEFTGFLRIRESCRRRLYCQEAAIAADREWHSDNRGVRPE